MASAEAIDLGRPNKHTAKLHHVGSLYILTYDARKLKHKIYLINSNCPHIYTACIGLYLTHLQACQYKNV